MYKEYLELIDNVIAEGKYKDNWESLSEYPVPKWYRAAKFGAFIHWGVYSVPAYKTEWYARKMYYKSTSVYKHHVKTYGKDFPYSKFVDMFKAEKFDAKDLVSKFKDAGFKYIMPVGEHHDGFKMYDSALCRWNAKNMAMQRDILGEIREECEKQGVEFATSSHRAEHYWFFNGAKTLKYPTEPLNPEFKDLYGDCLTAGRINQMNERGITIPTECLEDWLVNSAELIDKYTPSTLFFDWTVMKKEFRPYMKKFLAYYFNRSLEWGKEVCVQYKYDAVMYNCSITDKERGQLDNVSPYIWQSETAIPKNAWCYCTTNKWKEAEDIAAVFADVISKNGNFVLNFGPKSDGTLCKEEAEVLEKLTDWTKKNAAAIWGTSPYRLYGEGKKRKNGSFKENKRYSVKDYRFTYKPCHIYAFALRNNEKGVYRIKTFRKAREVFEFKILDISVLGYQNAVKWEQKSKYLEITLDKPIATEMPVCFDVHVD